MKRLSAIVVAAGFGLVHAVAAHAEANMMDECYIEVDGQIIIDGPCAIFEEEIGVRRVFDNYEENSGDATYDNFFMALIENDIATVYYNGGGGASHAHALIGELRLNDSGCYESETATFCAWYYEAPD